MFAGILLSFWDRQSTIPASTMGSEHSQRMREVAMAAKAVVVRVEASENRLWSLLRRLAEQRVSEGNIVAGERLWELVPSSSEELQFTIRSIRDQSDSIECLLDPETGVLTCKTGAVINGESLTFQLLGGTCWKMQCAGKNCTIDEVIARMLDQLIWIEDPV